MHKMRDFIHDELDIHSISKDYKGIDTPFDLYDALSKIWCARTCAPRMRNEWTPENMTYGQCSITAFLAQDIFGGIVKGVPLEDGNVHCYNVVDGQMFDLTSAQFPEALTYRDEDEIQTREKHFSKLEKKERYEYLCKALKEACV